MTFQCASIHPTLSIGEAVSAGLIAGATAHNKIGFNGDIDASTMEDIWNVGGLYTKLAAEQQLEVVSDDNTNDKAAGTGALTVRIGYLNTAFAAKTVDVTMNGTAAVATGAGAADILYVNSFRVLTAGTSGAAAGTVTLRRTSAGTAVSQIAPGQTRGRKLYYTVPAGYALCIDTIEIGAAGDATKDYLRFTLRANFEPTTKVATPVEYPFWEGCTCSGGRTSTFNVPFLFPAGTTVRMVVIGSSTTANCVATAAWFGKLIPV